MTESLEDAFTELRREYIAEASGRLAELRKDIAAFRAGEADAAQSLTTRFHRLSGSGGSYGFQEISDISREMERWLKQRTTPDPAGVDAERLEHAVGKLAAAFDQAAGELGLPAEPSATAEFGWRSLIVAPPSALRGHLEEALRSTGFLVKVETDQGEPKPVHVSERPDLVVIVADLAHTDPYAVASAWSGAGATRPRAIVLVDPSDSVDRIRALAAGVDVIFPAERIHLELPKYAKTLARIGTPPPRVLLVEEDPAQAALIIGWLEQANARVTHCTDGITARDLLGRETPDLLLMDLHLPGLDGLSLARLVRQDPRFALIPIVFLTAQQAVSDQIEALRAGADHFLIEPADQHLLTQLVVNRAERGRRLREMVHRDGLTGLLNHATLMAELEHAVEYARRHGETFAFIMIDVDHFKRVNDRYGHLVGDQVLLHVAKEFQSIARASDLLGRYGGEEFGIILRRTDRNGAGVLAGKLRHGLAAHPFIPAGGERIPIRVCMGIACYPRDGMTAAGLALQADQALYRAKARGRDRVEFAEDGTTQG
jgi:diguanylate cyclase (GGDEF)-like protein